MGPSNSYHSPVRRLLCFMVRRELITFRNPRARSYSQYTLVDDPPAHGSIFTRWANFQQGLRFASGKPKPGVYAAYRMPAFVRTRGHHHVEVFGGLRAGVAGELVVIESRPRGGHYSQIATAHLNSAGYFRRGLRISAPSRRRYKISIGGFTRVKRPA